MEKNQILEVMTLALRVMQLRLEVMYPSLEVMKDLTQRRLERMHLEKEKVKERSSPCYPRLLINK